MNTAADLSMLSAGELDELFTSAEPGPIPHGIGRGRALVATGSRLASPLATLARLTAWKGKEFDASTGTLLNRIGPTGAKAIKADVYVGESRLDGRPCIVLDYAKTSRTARWIRDEIRQIGPGLYLGVVYVRSRRVPLRFALQFDATTSTPQVEMAGHPVAVGDVD
ncbi:MAG TPA: hypothetical protein VH761_14015 [Ilumatobacteraceae bacterium]